MIWFILAALGIGVGVAASKKTPPGKAPPPIAPTVVPARVLDRTLAPKETSAVNRALLSNTSPGDLENYAATLRPSAPQAADQLAARAKALRAKGVK